MRRILLLYPIVLAMWFPSVLSVYLGLPSNVCLPPPADCYLNFWDWYQATFMIIDILAFLPLSFLVVALAKNVHPFFATAFAVSSFWALLLGIPDWIIGSLSPEYQELPFASASIAFMVIGFMVLWGMARK